MRFQCTLKFIRHMLECNRISLCLLPLPWHTSSQPGSNLTSFLSVSAPPGALTIEPETTIKVLEQRLLKYNSISSCQVYSTPRASDPNGQYASQEQSQKVLCRFCPSSRIPYSAGLNPSGRLKQFGPDRT